MPLLDVNDLTMRFGGLTAVSKLDLHVPAGQIFSVIGPNGAGKTTVFNAITGIYEPTSGEICFNGRQLRRPVTWRLWFMCAVTGIATALAAAAFSLDIDGLWRVTVKRNYDFNTRRFDMAGAWTDFREYVAGALLIEPQPRGRWAVTTSDGETLLGALANQPTREAAQQLRDDVRALMDSGQPIVPVQRDQRWALVGPEGQRVLADYGSETMAFRMADRIAALRHEQRQRRRTAAFSLLGGLFVGAAGAAVIWNRARHTPDYIALSGVARTFQNIRLFGHMTVLENVMVGLDRVQSRNVLSMMLRTPRIRREEQAVRRQALEALRFVGLEAKSNSLANSLAYGDQRRLEIARALATNPQLLLLDEPAAGMNPAETTELTRLIRRIRERGVTVLLIEHHMNVVMGISDQVAVLDHGQKIAEGPPNTVRHDPKVIEAYLGKDSA